MTYATAFSARHLMSRNAKAWKFKRESISKQEPCQAKTLSNVKLLKRLISDKTQTSEEKVIFTVAINMSTSHENRKLMFIHS